jgi:DNA helicase-2/ATP-dependent DNA helicase PcrA
MLKDSGNEEDQDRLANIEELITAAKQFADEDNSRTITDFLENITLASDVDSWDQQQDCVAVMTMHAAKGLEFPVVFLSAVEQGLLPHERSLNKNEEIEEERRLAFVGMTRAKEELYLCHARMREFRGQTLYAVPSMFLNEVPPHAIEMIDLSMTSGRKALESFRGGGGPAARQGWEDAGVEIPLPIPPKSRDDEPYAVGTLVRHANYGVGKVVALSGFGAMRTVKIRFQTAGEHSFRTSHVKLEVLRK